MLLSRLIDIPIDIFVSQVMQRGKVIELINGWRIESEDLHRIVVRNLEDMGVYFVRPEQHDLIAAQVLFHLKNSPEIVMMNRKAEQEEANRRRNRHADV
jgi:hypothetical protein